MVINEQEMMMINQIVGLSIDEATTILSKNWYVIENYDINCRWYYYRKSGRHCVKLYVNDVNIVIRHELL
jgi:hypothetical protein